MSAANNDTSTSRTSLWQKIRGIRPPEGQSLVWWMINNQQGLLKQIAAFLAFLLAFRFLFLWTWSMSVSMLLSMYLHECGHAYVFWRTKIRFIILYLFPLGAVAAPINKEENEESDKLHWNTISWLLQAGPAVNVGLMIIFYAIQNQASPMLLRSDFGIVLLQFSRDMIYVNGLLAAMNLVPLWTLDAGQLFKVIYNSLEEHEDNWLTGLLLGSTTLVLLIIIGIPGFLSMALILANTIIRFGWVVFLIVFALGILNQQGRDNPLYAYSKQAMNNRQILIHLIVYTLLVGITLWIFAGPPIS